MTTPQRLQLSRVSGFRLQAASRALNGLACVKVDRATRWGNPYVVGETVDRAQVKRWGWKFSPQGFEFLTPCARVAVAKFRHCLLWDEALHDFIRRELGGRNLACWCALEQPHCHAEPLLWLANSTRADVRALQADIEERIMGAPVFDA